MKIHSNFKDYYDVGLKYLTEDEPVFIRNETVIKKSKHLIKTYDFEKHVVHYGMIFFVNNYYPFIKIENSYDVEFFYSFEKVKEYFESIMKPNTFKVWLSNRNYHSKYYRFDTSDKYQELFDPNFKANKWSIRDNIYLELKSEIDSNRNGNPIVINYHAWGHQDIILNGNLSQYSFQKIIDPLTAIHTLNTHLCNCARPENPIVNISDKDLAKSKGFDKWSFRKMGKNSK